MEKAEWWVQLIGVILGGGVVSALVGAIATRKKLSADTDSTFVTTADVQRRSLVEDRKEALAERDAEHDERIKLERHVRAWWARADRMMIWVRRQEARNVDAGIDDPAPPLYPPEGE
jgi:hypothetical protein